MEQQAPVYPRSRLLLKSLIMIQSVTFFGYPQKLVTSALQCQLMVV